MTHSAKFSSALFFLRITIFLVMFMWTIDKFFRPEHASTVFETFYFMPQFGAFTSYLIGAAELILILGFLLGVYKFFTYGAVLIFHTISTLSSIPQYLSPFEGPHLLFFTAWPMLAGCLLLFLFRNEDTLFNWDR